MRPTEPSLNYLALRLPKCGCTEDEYEDAWAADPIRGRFAVADGASESSFAGLWARLLTEGFITASRPHDLSCWLDTQRQRWSAEVMPLELPWYAEMKREQGAYATLVGLSIRGPTKDRHGRWQAVAIGDACLVRVRDRQNVQSFPMQRSTDFGNQPRLIGSRVGTTQNVETCGGSFRLGDRLFLMTDALAQWFLCCIEEERLPWEAIDHLHCERQPEKLFATWIADLREHDGLRNDDVTLLTITSSGEPEE